MRIELPPDAVRKLRGFALSHTWTCTCGAKLTIRAREGEDHADGPSNFDPKNPKQQPSELNWEALREERGWARDSDTITCPATQLGMTVADYKEMRRRERIAQQIAELKRQLQGA